MSTLRRLLATLATLVVAALLTLPAFATDKDGPGDCAKEHFDMGDAPECIPAYPSGVLGKFPTCFAPCTVPSTWDLSCPPISTAPGPAGFIRHWNLPGGYWLGCYPDATGMLSLGIDTDPDGKTNVGPLGFSACAPGFPTDCVESAYGMFFDQDECFGDGSDAGIPTPIVFPPCATTGFTFITSNCTPNQRQVFLNVCVDWNGDGDWNDNFTCPQGCAYEWAVKNAFILIGPGCMTLATPPFLSGLFDGPAWLRISISDVPMPDDYPWNGSAGMPGQFAYGGETEDYPVFVGHPTPTERSSWGRIKMLYR